MKSMSPDSPLDAFIKNTLKTPDVNLSPINWSEVEVLLCNEQKSILSSISKNTILMISGSVVVVAIAALGIIHMIPHSPNLPAKNKTVIDTAQSTFSMVDTNSVNAMDPVISIIDSIKIDSSSLARSEHSINSISHNSFLLSDTTALKKTSALPMPAHIETTQNSDKKQSSNTVHIYSRVDSGSEKKDSVQHRLMARESIPPLQEIKNQVSYPIDTNIKPFTPLKNTSKNKKVKLKKQSLLQPQNTPQLNPLETKSDSLKQ